MKLRVLICMLIYFTLTSCSKSEDEKEQITISSAVKTGDWMLLYFENGNSIDIGNATFLKFNSSGSLIATMDGTPYNGTWIEGNTGGNTTLTLNISTNDTKLVKANKIWQMTSITEGYITFKEASTTGNSTLHLMKH